jgi:hypothetical protein
VGGFRHLLRYLVAYLFATSRVPTFAVSLKRIKMMFLVYGSIPQRPSRDLFPSSGDARTPILKKKI